MSQYGYRLFTFEIFDGHKRRAVNFKDCNGEHYVDTAERLLKDLSTETRPGEPKIDDQGKPVVFITRDNAGAISRDTPAFRISEGLDVSGHLIRGELWSGRYGSHKRALGTGDPSQDSDIGDKAASRDFRFVLALPDDGTVGILAMEVISRSCPVSPLVNWLRWQSHQESLQGKVSGGASSFSWWRIRVSPLADEEFLEQMIRQGRVEKLEVIKHRVDRSRTRGSEKYRITAPLVEGGKVQEVAQLIKSWIRKEQISAEAPGQQANDASAARQLAAVVGPEIVDLDVDDGWVVVKDSFERKKKISPSRMSEIFTYPQERDGRFVTPQFYAAVKSTAMRLQLAHKITVHWP